MVTARDSTRTSPAWRMQRSSSGAYTALTRRIRATSSSLPGGAGRSSQPARTGTSVRARAREAAMAATTAAARGRYMRPSMPLMANRGVKTAMTIRVAKAMGRPTSMAAASTISRRGRSPPETVRRW